MTTVILNQGLKGQFSARDSSQPQNRISSNLWAGEIASGKYLFTGVSSANQQISNPCGLSPFVVDELTVWGTCGDNVIVNFETEDGITGFSTGTVACV